MLYAAAPSYAMVRVMMKQEVLSVYSITINFNMVMCAKSFSAFLVVLAIKKTNV